MIRNSFPNQRYVYHVLNDFLNGYRSYQDWMPLLPVALQQAHRRGFNLDIGYISVNSYRHFLFLVSMFLRMFARGISPRLTRQIKHPTVCLIRQFPFAEYPQEFYCLRAFLKYSFEVLWDLASKINQLILINF